MRGEEGNERARREEKCGKSRVWQLLEIGRGVCESRHCGVSAAVGGTLSTERTLALLLDRDRLAQS